MEMVLVCPPKPGSTQQFTGEAWLSAGQVIEPLSLQPCSSWLLMPGCSAASAYFEAAEAGSDVIQH